jgi:hypothetical protein
MNEFLKYLTTLQAKHKQGQQILWDKQHCDTLQSNVLAEINSEANDIRELKQLILNMRAFIDDPRIKIISRNSFYSSLNMYYQKAITIKANGEIKDIANHYAQDIVIFEQFMEKHYPIDNAFYFWINENKANLNKALFTQGFFQFLKKCKESNSARKGKFEQILILLVALAVANDDNNYVNTDKYMQTYGIDAKNKNNILKLASGGRTKAYKHLMESINTKITEIQEEIYGTLIKRFFDAKEKKHMKEIQRIERNLDISNEEVRKLRELFSWQQNYTWKELDNKVRTAQEVIKKHKKAA